MAREVRSVIGISDTHTGCSLALMRRDGARRDDGEIVMPSKLQLKLFSMWEELWGEWVPRVTHKEPFAVVHLGDCIDGVHHGSTTQWSHNLNDQSEHAYQLLKPVVEACEGRYYHIRGTEAHVGQSACEEERLAKRLGAIPNTEGQHARYDLWLRLGGHLCHFLHHIGTSSSAQSETSALCAEYAAMCVDAARFGREPPTIVARAHRHRNSEIRLPAHGKYATVFVTPCWQAKTPFAWKISGARVQTPQIGGSLIRAGDEEVYTRHLVHSLEPSPEVSLSAVSAGGGGWRKQSRSRSGSRNSAGSASRARATRKRSRAAS